MTALSPVRRPLVRWFGGKWRLAPRIIALFPPHRVYVEAYGGGGSVLLRKPRARDVYNDLDGAVVNLFRVLQDPALADALIRKLYFTPYARQEFLDSYLPTDDPVDRAHRLIVMSFMGFGSNAHAGGSTGFRANANRNGTTPAEDWANYPEVLHLAVDRLRAVTVDNRDARRVMAQHDAPDTLHYIDPPYPRSTRGRYAKQRMYRHDMEDDDHVDLLDFVRELQGKVVISGYAHELYDVALKDWRRIEINTHADGAQPRTEVLWLNYDPPRQQSLAFAEAAA